MKKVFLAGIIQGSREDSLEKQDYRGEIRSILESHRPGWALYCPIEDYEKADGYPDTPKNEVFFRNIEKAAASDLLIAYIPSASMGTAVEVYEAWRNGIPVYTISPLEKNWAVRFLSTRVFACIDEFADFLEKGDGNEI